MHSFNIEWFLFPCEYIPKCILTFWSQWWHRSLLWIISNCASIKENTSLQQTLSWPVLHHWPYMYVVNGTVRSQYILCTDQIVNYACKTSLQQSTFLCIEVLVEFKKGHQWISIAWKMDINQCSKRVSSTLNQY